LLSWTARTISLPLSISQGDDSERPKIVDWLPWWGILIAIPLTVFAAFASGFWIARFF
jgi:hypothetical protein